MKKGQGISINAIIVAAIALIVLVVLIAIFSGRMGIFSREVTDTTQGTADCEDDLGGSWMSAVECESLGRPFHPNPLADDDEMSAGGTKVCCIP